VGADGSTLVANSSASTGVSWAGPTVTAGKNRIINGAFDIWQRGTSFSGVGGYTADRWKINDGTPGNVTISQVTGTTGFQYAYQRSSTGTSSFTQLGQQIEFANCYDLQNQTVTISFWAKANNANSASTALTVRTRTVAGVDGAALFSGTASDTSKTLTTSWAYYTVTKALPATFGALSLEFAGASGASGDGYSIDGIQLELGSVATAFSRAGGTLQGELAACQRYYYRTSAQTYGRLGFGSASSTTNAQILVNLPSTMRTAPASVDYSTLLVYDTVTLSSVTNVTLTATGQSTNTAAIDCTVASGLTQYRPYSLTNNNSTSAYIGFSAEL